MPIPIQLMRRLAWGRLREKAKRRLLNAIPNSAYFAIMKMQRRKIVVLATGLGLPKRRLREHFEGLRKTVPENELGQRMVDDLDLALKLATKTGLIGEKSNKDSRRRFKKNLQNKPLAEVINEMREYAEAMPKEPAAKKVA